MLGSHKPILAVPDPADGPLRCVTTQDHGLDKALDVELIEICRPAIDSGEPVRAALKKALLDAPPPGVVHLRDLSPGMAAYEGKAGLDFLQAAREEWAKAPPPDTAEPFTYVQIGTPTFDQFFKQAGEFHGLTF